MCSKPWCGYLQLDRSTASHKSSTEQSWGSLLRASRGGFSICLHLNVGKKTLPESVTVTAQSATYLEASHGLGKCCSPKFGHSLSLISTRPAGLWLPSPASPGQSPSGDSRLLQSNTQARRRTLSRRKTEPRMHINYWWHKAQARLLLHSQAINLSK